MAKRQMAMVTGGSHGIGRGIALVLARHGYDVALTYNRREEDALEVKRQIEALGRRCFLYQVALNRPDTPEPAVRKAIADLGHLDLMVCNAGYTKHFSVLNVTNEQIDDMFNLNYRAYLLCAKAAARHMVREGIRGSIVFITSSRAEQAYPEDMLYGGFKAGIKRACESIALDLAPYGIRANCIAPGATSINTVDEVVPGWLDACVPLKRLGTPREVGEAVYYLASEPAGYITGITLRMDGGLILPGFPESMPDKAEWLNPEWVKRQRTLLDETEDES